MRSNVQKIIEISRYRGFCSDEEQIFIDYLRSIDEEKAVEILKYILDQKSLISTLFAKWVLELIFISSHFETIPLRNQSSFDPLVHLIRYS